MGWWREWRGILPGILVMGLVGGCALLEKQVKQPEVSVGNVRVLGMSLADAQIAIDLDVDNPNPFGLSMKGLSYRLALQDKPLFNGIVTEPVQVKANGSSRVTLPFTVRFEDALGTVLGLAQFKELRYELSGKADFGLITLPYSRSGSFALPRLPDVSVQHLRVERIGLSGVELALGLKVNNANAFPVRFAGLSYDLRIADAPVLKGESTQSLSVSPNGSGTLNLKLAFDYGQLGNLAKTLGSARSLPLEFNGRVIAPGKAAEVAIPYQWKGRVPLLR
ncbi:MAG: LEA type 2 family protein [Thiohalomonadaceae bacterium]